MKKIMPHITIIFSVFSLVLLIIDKINEPMNFINNDIYKNLLIIFFAGSLVWSVIDTWRSEK
ncbi:MAG: hypothetical protein IKM38_04150 [Christensenellaceae bacterium]|nr:hypothetical protein [Christensenellaceae bacterium]